MSVAATVEPTPPLTAPITCAVGRRRPPRPRARTRGRPSASRRAPCTRRRRSSRAAAPLRRVRHLRVELQAPHARARRGSRRVHVLGRGEPDEPGRHARDLRREGPASSPSQSAAVILSPWLIHTTNSPGSPPSSPPVSAAARRAPHGCLAELGLRARLHDAAEVVREPCMPSRCRARGERRARSAATRPRSRAARPPRRPRPARPRGSRRRPALTRGRRPDEARVELAVHVARARAAR